MPKITKENARQTGFFVSADGGAFHTIAHTGDKMIKPVVKHETKPRKPTPFHELMTFYGILRKRALILEGYGMYEDLNGIVHIQQNGAWSETSTEESSGILKQIASKRPDLPEIPILSDAAQRLKYVWEHQKERKPFVTDHLVPRPPKDVLGEPLK